MPLAAANRRLEDLDNERAEVKVDVDRSSLASLRDLGSGLGELAGGLRNIKTVIGAARIPFLIASLGAVPAIASSAAVAVGQLALGLSQGLAGAAVVGGTAIGGLVAGLTSYVGIVSSVVSATRSANDVLNEHHKEQLQMQRAQILNTSAAQRFNSTLDSMILSLTRVQAQVGTRVLPTFTRWINLLDTRLPQITPILMRLVDGVTAVADSFVRAIATGERFDRLQRVLGFIASSGIRAAQIAKQLGLALLAAVQPVLRPAASLQRTILNLSRDFRRWAENAGGQNQIAAFMQDAWNRARQLFRVVGNLGTGFKNLFSIIAPGTGGMMKSLENLSASFAKVGAKGTESRRKIQEFVNNSKPILKALGNLVGTITREFFKLAGGVAKMRNGKRDVGTLADAINGLARAIPPVRRLLQQTFKDLGPTIGPLAKQIARFFKEFAGSTDVLTRTVRLMTGLLRQFNKLPGPVKGAVAELVAFRIISKALGFGILVKLAASLGKASLAMLTYTKRARAGTVASRGFLAANSAAKWGAFGAIVGTTIVGIQQNLNHFKDNFLPRYGKALKETMKKPFGEAAIAARMELVHSLLEAPFMPKVVSTWAKPGLDWLENKFPERFGKVGQDSVDGFIKGFNSRGDFMKEFAEKTVQDARNHFGIRSPSKVFEQRVGQPAAEGVIVGFEKAMHRGRGRMAKALSGGFAEMEARWRPLLKKIKSGQEFDIGGDMDKADTPRAIWNALKAAGWIVRGNQIFHPDTPRSALPKPPREPQRRTGMVQAEDGSWVPKSFYNKTDYRPVKAAIGDRRGINKEEMRQVMREHRSESRRGQGGGGTPGLAQEIARAVITVLNSGAYASHLDRSMGGYFDLRNSMGADPR